jgi:hypothetical protein
MNPEPKEMVFLINGNKVQKAIDSELIFSELSYQIIEASRYKGVEVEIRESGLVYCLLRTDSLAEFLSTSGDKEMVVLTKTSNGTFIAVFDIDRVLAATTKSTAGQA